MKKLLATLLAAVFVLTGFGLSTVFCGIIAGAEFYDYYIYTDLPGFSNFTDDELAKFQGVHNLAGQNETIEGVGDVVTWELTTPNTWGSYRIYSIYGRNLRDGNHSDSSVAGNMPNPDWAALDTVNGKTVMGDNSFKGQTGISMWIGINGVPYTGKMRITLKQVPCSGPFFLGNLDEEVENGSTSEELQAAGTGFSYESKTKHPDSDGYIHFDFKTDFRQVDWWTKDDDGINRSIYADADEDGILNGDDYFWPIPKSKIELISGFTFSVDNAEAGDKISLGDIRMYKDSRVFLDELDEQLLIFESLNSEAYTEDSYIAASDAYFAAYEVYYDEEAEGKYDQEQIDEVAATLRKAIANLKQLFPSRSEEVVINGFEVLTEEDIEAINNGGSSLDMAYLTDEVIPENSGVATSICAIGGAFMGEPSYGWSNFQTTVEGEDGPVAVKNVFGAENLDLAAGIRFWFAPADTYEPKPSSIIVGVGSSSLGAYFETEDGVLDIPENSGYIFVPWGSLIPVLGDYDIYDAINEFDYFSIKISECAAQTYYISDLHAYEWSLNSANFTEMDKLIVETQNYLDTLNKEEWSPRSWQRVENAIAEATSLHELYGATQEDVSDAINAINSSILRLTPIWDSATQEEVSKIENAYASASDYWSGNYTGASFANLRAVIDEVKKIIDDEMSSDECNKYITQIEDAIKGLVPVAHSSLATSVLSFENMTSRQFSRAVGHRTETVEYNLTGSAAAGIPLPEGYSKALHMKTTEAMSTVTTDEHGNMQFKLFDSYQMPIVGDIDDPQNEGNKIGGVMGNLTGTAGIRLWIGVNDISLFENATFRFGVSNCTEGPLFERHCVDIPFPSTGSGWLYLPWEYFEYYDEWTKGEMINLMEMRFYIIRVDGDVPAGAELYVTGVAAYNDPKPTENVMPVIENITEGQQIDVSGGAFVPKWSIGSASLNGVRFEYGSGISANGQYTFKVVNGDKEASVSFTITGGVAEDALPIISGVVDGGVYEEAVTLSWTVGTGKLNGVEIENGSVVSASGKYSLEVVNGTKSASVSFTIEGKEPDVMKGDPDGDGMITVADALYTLRIAAQLTEGTADDLLVVDTDGDGSVTVADALAILRVAAQLADSL